MPDETDRVPVTRLSNPKRAEWPEADFIVGNPPFNFGKHLRSELGDGYAEAYWKVYPNVPEAADYVMAWWDRAAELVGVGRVRRSGLITTNSLTQIYNRRIVQARLADRNPISIVFAVADHPWSDAAHAAAVRIAMTVCAAGRQDGTLLEVVSDTASGGGEPALVFRAVRGRINSDLTIGADVASAQALEANRGLSFMGVMVAGAGFLLTPQQAAALGRGRTPGLEQRIRPYLNGRDLVGRPRGLMAIDMFGLTDAEMRQRFPAVYQHLLIHVKPERDVNARDSIRRDWWLFGGRGRNCGARCMG